MRFPAWVKEFRKNKKISKVMEDYPPERRLGSGAYKFVYESRGCAVGLTYSTKQLKYEIKALARLKDIGLRVVKIKKSIITENCGIVIMKLYRPIKRKTEDVKQQCAKVAKILKDHRLFVYDLHVMMDDRGKVVLADPLEIRRKRCDERQEFWLKDKGGVCGDYLEI